MSHPVRSRFAKVVFAVALCGPGGPLSAQFITVVSWGGSYARASQEAYHKPFTAETGVEMRPLMPNTPENTQRALRSDRAW